MKSMNIVAGAELVNSLEAEKEARVKKVGQWFESESLCAFQREVSRRGVLGAEVVETIYGFSLRYDSGLQNFGIIVRRIPTFDAAVIAAAEWVAEDAGRRYAWSRIKREAGHVNSLTHENGANLAERETCTACGDEGKIVGVPCGCEEEEE